MSGRDVMIDAGKTAGAVAGFIRPIRSVRFRSPLPDIDSARRADLVRWGLPSVATVGERSPVKKARYEEEQAEEDEY